MESQSDNLGVERATALEERRARAATRLAAAQAELSRASRLSRLWDSINEGLRARQVNATADHVQKAIRRDEGLLQAEERGFLRELAADLDLLGRKAVQELPATLPKELQSVGLELDPNARHPRYTIDSGFITAEVDEKSRFVSVSSRGGKTRRLPADARPIAEALQDLHKRLFLPGRPTFSWNELVGAYLLAADEAGLQPGALVALDALRLRLEQMRPASVPWDEFNVDLSRAIRGSENTGAFHLAVANTRDTEQGILLHLMDAAGYVGYIQMDRTDAQAGG